MLRRLRQIGPWVCLALFVLAAWLLAESFHRPRILWHRTEYSETAFTILSGCFEYGRPVPDKRKYLSSPYAPETWVWHLGYVEDGVGEMQLPGFFPGFGRGRIFVSSFGPSYYGPILAGYWVLLALLIPTLPLLWRPRRTLFRIVLPSLASLGSLMMWHRSYHTADRISADTPRPISIFAVSDSGVFCAGTADDGPFASTNVTWSEDRPTGYYARHYSAAAHQGRVLIPGILVAGYDKSCWIWARYWLAAACICLIAMPILILEIRGRLRFWQSNRRKAAGLCRGCGYDLRASPGCCPECGAVGA